MAPEIEIVRFSVSWLEAVAALEERAGDVRWSKAQFEKELSLPMSRFFVVTEAGALRSCEKNSFVAPAGRRPGASLEGKRLGPGLQLAGPTNFSHFLTGYGGYWKVDQEAQITNLVIDPARRRQGLGKRLLGFLLDEARAEGCRWCTLEVRDRNFPAQKLYQAMGFQAMGRRPNVYNDPRALRLRSGHGERTKVESNHGDAVLMEKAL